MVSLSSIENSNSVQLNPYYESKLQSLIKSYAVGLIGLANNNQFKTLINTETAKEFDGDRNVLFKKLSVESFGININLINSLHQSISVYKDQIINSENSSNTINTGIGVITDNTLNEGMDGFKYYEDTLYLHIYVPPICPNGV